MRLHLALVCAVFVIAAGCSREDQNPGAEQGQTVEMPIVELQPTQGSSVRGTVTLMPMGGGVHFSGTLRGLTPGKHGFHVHEKGDCSAPDASSAGAHFNPTNQPHGAPDAAEHHVGDLGNTT